MTRPALPPVESLHFDNVTAEAQFVDWSETACACACAGPDDAPAPVLPPVSADVLDEFAPDWRAAVLDDGDDDESDVLAHAAEAFRAGDLGDGADDWRDGFWPMMNFAWPVDLRGTDPETAAERIAAHAPDVTLMRMGADWRGEERFALALTAGGMDLSPSLAAAYVACGAVPPLRLLSHLPGYWSCSPDAAPTVRAAMHRAAGWLDTRAEDLRRHARA